MKKHITIIFAIVSFQIGLSQIGVIASSKVMGATVIKKEIEPGDLEELKNSTTVFVLQNKEKAKINDYKKAAEQVWNFNKIFFVTNDELDKYLGKSGYSFFSPSRITVAGGGGTSDAYFMSLWIPDAGKKGKTEAKPFAVYIQYRDVTAGLSTKWGGTKSNEPGAEDIFYDLTPGYVKCFLSVINSRLKENKGTKTHDEVEDTNVLKEMEKDTLFIPDYVLIGVGMKGGKKLKIEDLLEKYSFPYKVLSNDELSNKIINAKKNTFILSYLYYGNSKCFTVFEGKSGKMIYNSHKEMAMKGITDSDFNTLFKIIAKTAGHN